MKKVLLSAVMFVGITATAQDYEKRVGVNTETPRASLEVKAINNGTAQGILFPHISETEKARWAKDNNKGLVAGTVIWNTTKICLDYFDGTNWQCTDGTKPNVHPTPWTSTPTPPPATTYTGTAIWGDDESISARRNNCPTGQSGSSVTYPANNTQHITYTATSTVSQAEANQKALDLMNSSTEVAKRQQLAQDYANANGTCTANPFAAIACVANNPGTYGIIRDEGYYLVYVGKIDLPLASSSELINLSPGTYYIGSGEGYNLGRMRWDGYSTDRKYRFQSSGSTVNWQGNLARWASEVNVPVGTKWGGLTYTSNSTGENNNYNTARCAGTFRVQ